MTRRARTLFDLAAVAQYEAVEEALDDALHRGIVSIPSLRRRLDEAARRGRPGIVAIRSMLDARDPSKATPQSVFETRLLRHLNRRKVPPPIPQYRVYDQNGLVGIVDFAWPEARLALEADGFRWHSARTRFEHDRVRGNRLTLLRWSVIHVTWAQLMRSPDTVVDSVETALAMVPR